VDYLEVKLLKPQTPTDNLGCRRLRDVNQVPVVSLQIEKLAEKIAPELHNSPIDSVGFLFKCGPTRCYFTEGLTKERYRMFNTVLHLK
jgi:hypothetical protein